MNVAIIPTAEDTITEVLSEYFCPKCTSTNVEQLADEAPSLLEQWLHCLACDERWTDARPGGLVRNNGKSGDLKTWFKGQESVAAQWARGEIEHHRFADFFPMIAATAPEARDIEASMREFGYDESEPVILYAGGQGMPEQGVKILDGRNRSAIALKVWGDTKEERHMPEFVLFVGTELEALELVRRRNLGRRHLSQTQLAASALQIYGELLLQRRDAAAKRLALSPPTGGERDEDGDDWNDEDDEDDEDEDEHSPTAKQTADLTGASARSIERLQFVKRNGPAAVGQERTDALMAGCLEGDVTARAAEEEVKEAIRQQKAEKLRAEEKRRQAELADAEADAAPGARYPGKILWDNAGVLVIAGDGVEVLAKLETRSVGSLVLHVDAPRRPMIGKSPKDNEADQMEDYYKSVHWLQRAVQLADAAVQADANIWVITNARGLYVWTDVIQGEAGLGDAGWDSIGMWCLPRFDERNGAGEADHVLLWCRPQGAPKVKPQEIDDFAIGIRELNGGARTRAAGEVEGEFSVELVALLLARHPGRAVDPFCGTGATAAAALLLGRPAVVVELLDERVEVAKGRAFTAAQRSLTGLFDLHADDPKAAAASSSVELVDDGALPKVWRSITHYVSRKVEHQEKCIRCGAKQNKRSKTPTCIGCGYEVLPHDDLQAVATGFLADLDEVAGEGVEQVMILLEQQVTARTEAGTRTPSIDDHAGMLILVAMGLIIVEELHDDEADRTTADPVAWAVAAMLTVLLERLDEGDTPAAEEINDGVGRLVASFETLGDDGLELRAVAGMTPPEWYEQFCAQTDKAEMLARAKLTADVVLADIEAIEAKANAGTAAIDLDLLARQGETKTAAAKLLAVLAEKGKAERKRACELATWLTLSVALTIEKANRAHVSLTTLNELEAEIKAKEGRALAEITPPAAAVVRARALAQWVDLGDALEQMRTEEESEQAELAQATADAEEKPKRTGGKKAAATKSTKAASSKAAATKAKAAKAASTKGKAAKAASSKGPAPKKTAVAKKGAAKKGRGK